ncbi:response regulator [Streptomyces griseoviridis]|uniref:Response regulator n=1 Tax=Streptomyces griseoviridis TaxID=45398 RepID=A0A918G3X3_STRGD|nr:response regulator [Streptomyces niveoruber]GGS17025.1 response regulator [Streptomyces niveoruber]
MTAGTGTGRLDPGSVLVVEDSPEDTEAIERALRQTHPDLRTEFVARGDGLVETLLAREELPGLILLDLNMPGVGGHALLAAIRARPELRDVTVVVFTSSTSPHEVEASYAAGADSYIYKPVNFRLFRTVLKGAVDYWRQQSGPGTGL